MPESASPSLSLPRRLRAGWVAAAPALFVVLWSSGYIGARAGLAHAEPFSFLFVRYAILAALMAAVGLATRTAWPRGWRAAGHTAMAGLLLHGVTFIGVFAALDRGTPAAVIALVMGLQPLLTAVAAGRFLGERVRGRQWLGLALGLGGLAAVLADKLESAGADLAGVALAALGLFGITAGTLYQKRHGATMDLRSGYAIQFAAAAAATGGAALLFEELRIAWTGEFVLALAYLVVVLSLGAVSLLYMLIRRGAASKVASLFYLVPPATALIFYGLYGETLAPLALAGMAVAVAGVALASRS